MVTLSHESSALQSRLEVEQASIQRMEAVLELVERFQSGESAPGEGPSLQVPSAEILYSYILYSYTLLEYFILIYSRPMVKYFMLIYVLQKYVRM